MHKLIKFLTKKRYAFQISINWIKVSCWIFWLWLVVSLFVTVSGLTTVTEVSFKGDHGILVLLTVLISFLVPLLLRDSKNERIIGGLTLLVFSLVTFVGTLITTPTGLTVIIWTIPLICLAAISLFWFLVGLKSNSNSSNKNYKIIDKPNKKEESETFSF